MSRDMRAANRGIFAALEAYCARREEPIPSAGKRRYVSFDGDEHEKDLLKHLSVGLKVVFGTQRFLAHFRHQKASYIALVGFDFEPRQQAVSSIDVSPGMAVCVLSELAPQPIATPAVIRNVVEVGSMDEGPGYAGHRVESIQSLFPSLQAMTCIDDLDNEALWRLFLMICVDECERGGSWVEEPLSQSLITLGRLELPLMPYSAICRSIFDLDPRSLFMALYRCIEATYAAESSKRLVERLGLELPWQSIAEALERELGWRPQEASSLNLVLGQALRQDLIDICECLNVVAGDDVSTSAGRAIYALRNSIVHFRPGTNEVAMHEIDWNRLCQLMVNVVVDVFTHAYA